MGSSSIRYKKIGRLVALSLAIALIITLLSGLVINQEGRISLTSDLESVNKSYGYPTAYIFKSQTIDSSTIIESYTETDYVIAGNNFLIWASGVMIILLSIYQLKAKYENSRD